MSGFCELGCTYDAKENARKILVPQALAAGANVYSDVRVTRILHRHPGEVTGVEGVTVHASGEEGNRVVVTARVVVLAGSAVGSAVLAKESNLPDPYEQIGKCLRLHPAAVVAGRFDYELRSVYGIPQSYESTEFLSFEEGSEKRTWIIPAFAHPIGTASTLPGFGAPHMRAMREYNHLAVLTAMLHDETSGAVSPGSGGAKPTIRYKMLESDRAALARGLIGAARILFAAGAREVSIPAIPPVIVRSARALDALDTGFIRPHGVPLTAVHPMGTLRMGRDPRVSAVDAHGEFHGVPGLFVGDGSLFPTSIGGPPQIPIYAMALHISPHVIARTRQL